MYEITVELSLEMWVAGNHDQLKLEWMPLAQLEEWRDATTGHATVKTPDGRVWWAPVWGSPDEPWIVGDTAKVLAGYATAHNTRVHPDDEGWPILFFERSTLDPTCVFCTDCMALVNLSDDAKFYESGMG